MEQNNTTNLQQTLTQNLKQLSDLSLSLAQPLVGNLAENFTSLSQSVLSSAPAAINIPKFKLQSDDCCAPKNECPPHCLHQIHRTAMVGERILIPFIVKNGCSSAKTYRIGVRELKDLDGQMAPDQPLVNKASVSLAGGQQERVLLMIDLSKFAEKTYQVEVVLREKDYNQNLCITLQVGSSAAPVVIPVDEKKYRLRWQSWKDHFYCDTGDRKQRN